MAEKGTVHVKVIGDLKDLRKEIGSIGRKPFKLSLDDKGFSQPLGRITGKLGEFDKSLDASNARVIAFGASAGAIMGVQRALKSTVSAAIEVEKALADINVILGAGEKNLARFGDQLFKIAANTGQTFKVVATAATELARQGLSVTETLKRTSDALVLTRLSGLDAVSSVESLTASINSFNRVALTSTEIVNKLANVDAAFAVSSADLAEALRRVGSTASDAGVSFDQLIAAVTSAQQVTARGGSVIGNSFKTIFTRLQRPAVLKQLDQLGIKTKGLGDAARPVIGILTDLAKVYDKLGSSQRAQISELIGGVFQINIVKAALSDLGKEYSIYDRALATSVSSTNEAITRNEELNKTLSALINKTFANLQKVGARVGEGAFAPAIKNVLGFVNKSLEGGGGEQGAEDFGGKVAKGIFKGLGDFLSGPGLVLGASLMFKMFSRLTSTLTDAFKTIAAQNKQTMLKVKLEKEAFGWLTRHPDILNKIKNGTISISQAQETVSRSIQHSTNELNEQYAAVKLIVDGLMASKKLMIGVGVGTAKTGEGGLVTKSGGLIPTKREREMEKSTATQLGYAAGGVKADNIKGVGRVVYNSNEDRVQFEGMSSEAIMPPKSSKAGQRYKKGFKDQHGFDPYKAAGDMMAGGMVPNFARDPRFTRKGNVYNFAGTLGGIRDVVPRKAGGTSDFERMVKNLRKAGELNVEWDDRFTSSTVVKSYDSKIAKGKSKYMSQAERTGAYLEKDMEKDLKKYGGVRAGETFSKKDYKKLAQSKKRWGMFSSVKSGESQEKFQGEITRAGGFTSKYAPADIMFSGQGKYQSGEGKNVSALTGGPGPSKLADFYRATIGKHIRDMLGRGLLMPQFTEGTKTGRDDISLGRQILGVGGLKNVSPGKDGVARGTLMPKDMSGGSIYSKGWGASGGIVPNFARFVFDKDAYLQKYADKNLLQSRLDETGTKNLKELFDYDVTQAGKKGNLTVINAAAGAGKTSLAMGKRGKLAFSSIGMSKKDQSVVVRSTESITAGKDALLNRTYARHAKRFITLLPEEEAIRQGRESRGETGKYMFGRAAKQTSGAGVDFLAQAAVLEDAVGSKHRAFTRGTGANQPWKKYGGDMPKVHTRPTAVTTGAFSPFTLGHQALLDKMQKTGMPTAASVAGGKNRKHDIGLSVKRKMQLLQEANPQTATVGGGHLPQIFTAPADMPKMGIKKGDVISSTPEGSLAFLGTDRFNDSKTGKRGIFDLKEVKRSTGDISATKVREAIQSGDVGSYSKMLPKNVGNFVTGNLGDIQAMQGMMSRREAKKMGGVTSRLGVLWGEMGVPFNPSAKSPVLSPKRKREFPVQAAEITQLNEQRKKTVSHKWRKRVFPHLGGGLIPNFMASALLKKGKDFNMRGGSGSFTGAGEDKVFSKLGGRPGTTLVLKDGSVLASDRPLHGMAAMDAGIDPRKIKGGGFHNVRKGQLSFRGSDMDDFAGGFIPSFAKDYLKIVTEKLAKGSIQGFNQNQPYMQVLAQNPHLMARYQELKAGAAGRKKATSATTAGIDAQVARSYAGKGAKAVFLQNLKEPTVARRTPSVLRHGFDPDVLPGVRSTFMGSLDNRWEKLIRGVAFDTFRTIPPNKLKSFGGVKKLMSGLETRGLTKIPVTMGPVKGRVFEEFINAMSPVINRRAHETGAERVDLANRKIKSQYQGLFTPGMPGTGAEIRSGSLSERKARQKFGLAGGLVPNFAANYVGRRKIPSDLNIASYNKLKWPGGRPPGRAKADKKRKLAELEKALQEALRLSKPYKRSKDAKPWEWDAAGLIPNFSNPLTDAFTRERAAGIPASRIRVGTSPRLASGLNPAGLGVYNTLHEPGGLNQGINRSKAQGLNPKGAGIPNFAPVNPLEMMLAGTGGSSAKEAAAKVRRGMEEVADALGDTSDSLDIVSESAKIGGFEKFQSKALQASFILPMVSGQLQQVMGQNTKWGKAVGGLTDGISVAASFIGVGGPWGVAAGAVIGGFMALDKGLTAFNTNVEDLNLESGNLKEEFTRASNGLSSYGDALQQYQSALLNTSSSADLIVRLQDKMAEALKDVPSAFQDQVLAARNSTELQEKVADGLKEMAKTAAQAKFAASLEEVTSGERTGFAAFSKRTLGKDWFDIDVFEEIRGSAKKFASDFRSTLDFKDLSLRILDKDFLGGTQEEIVRKLEKEFDISEDVAFGLRDMSNQDFGEFSSSLQLMAQATALASEKTEAAAEAHKKFKVRIEEQTRKIHLLEKEFQGLIKASKFMADTFSQQKKFMEDFNATAKGLSRTGTIKGADRALKTASPFMTKQAIAANKARIDLAGIRDKTLGGQDKIMTASAKKRRDAVIKLEAVFLKAIEAQAVREGLKEGQVTRDPTRQAAIVAFREELQNVVRRQGDFFIDSPSVIEQWQGFRSEDTPTSRERGAISEAEIEALQVKLDGTGVGKATGELVNEFRIAQNDVLNANIKQTQALTDLKQTNDEQLDQAKKSYEAQVKQIQIAQDISAAGGAEGFASGVGDTIMQEMADAQAGIMLGRKMGSIGVMGRGATMAEMAIQRATGAPSGNEWLRNVATKGRQAQLSGMFGLMGIRGQDTGRMAKNQMDALFKPGTGLLPETVAATAATQIDYTLMNQAHKDALSESEGILGSINDKMDAFSKDALDMLKERAKAALELKGTGRDKEGNLIPGGIIGLEQQRADTIKADIAAVSRKGAIKSGTRSVTEFHSPSEAKRRMDLIDTTWDAWGKDEALRFDALIKQITRQVWDKSKPDQFKTLTKEMAESGHPLIAKTADGKQYKNILGVDSLAGLNKKMIDMWETDVRDMSKAMKDFQRMLPQELRDKSYRPQWEDAYSDMQSAEAGPMRAKIDAMFDSISKYIDAEAIRLTKNRPVPTEAYGSIPGGREMEKRMLKGNRQYSASESARATPRRRNINGKPTWLNSEEMVMPNFAGSGKQAVLTPSMRKRFGMADGHIPNFYDDQDWSDPNYKSGGRSHFSDLEPIGWAGAAGAGTYGLWKYRDWIRAKITPTNLLERRQMMKGLKPLIGSSFSGKEFKEFKKLMKALDYADGKGVPLQIRPVVPYGGDRLDTGGGNVHNLRDIAFDAAKTTEDRIKAIKELLNDSNLHRNVGEVKASMKADPTRTRWFRKGAPAGEAPLKYETKTGMEGVGERQARLAEMERLSESAAERSKAQKLMETNEKIAQETTKQAKIRARYASELSEIRIPPRTPPGSTVPPGVSSAAKAGSWLESIRRSSAGTVGRGALRGMSMFDPATTSWANPNLTPWATPPATPATVPPPTSPNLLQRTGTFIGETWSKMPNWAKTTGRYASRAAVPFAKLGKGVLPALGGAGQVGLVGETATGAGGFAQAQQQIYGTSIGEPNPVFKLFGIDTPGFDLGGNVSGSRASSSFATEEERDKFFQGSEIMRASKMLRMRQDMIMRPTRNYKAANFSKEDRSFYNEYVKKETEKLRNYHDHNMHVNQSWFHRQYGVQENTGVKAKKHDKFLRENYQRYLELKDRLNNEGFANGFIPNFADEGKIQKMVDIKMLDPLTHSYNSSGKPGHHRTFNFEDIKNWEKIAMDVGTNMGIDPPMMKNYLPGIGVTKIGIYGDKNKKYDTRGAYDARTDIMSLSANKVQSLLDGDPGGIGTLSNELTHVIQDRFMAQHPDVSVQGAVGNLKNEAAANKLATGGGRYQGKLDESIQALEKKWKKAISTHGLKRGGDRKKWWLDRAGEKLFRVVVSGGVGGLYQEGDMGGLSGPYSWAKDVVRDGKIISSGGEKKLEWQSTLNAYLAELKARYGYANGYLPNFALQGRPSSKIGGGSAALSGVNMGIGWFDNPFYKKIAMQTPGLMGLMNSSGFGFARTWSNRGAYGDGIAANGSVPNFAGSNSIRASQNRERKASGRGDVYTKYVDTPNFSGYATFNGSERGRERAIVRSHPNPRSAGATPNFASDSSDVKNAMESLTGQLVMLAEQMRLTEQARGGPATRESSHQLSMSPLNVNVNHSGKLTTEIAAVQNQISLAIENAMKQIAPALWSTIKGPSTV